ncbi:hypothetical protein ACHAXS_006155 [Conticribra weissflogii]
MKSPNPKSLNLVANKALLALSVLGGGGAVVSSLCTTGDSCTDADASSLSHAKNNEDQQEHKRKQQRHQQLQQENPRGKSQNALERHQQYRHQAKPAIVITSRTEAKNPILATSDAAADRYASLAAERRWKGHAGNDEGIFSSRKQTRNRTSLAEESEVSPTKDLNKEHAMPSSKNDPNQNSLENSEGVKSNKSCGMVQCESEKHSFTHQNLQFRRKTNPDKDHEGNKYSHRTASKPPDSPKKNEGDASKNEEDSYPIFTQYHKSLLKKYLTPSLWSKLSHLQTSFGTTIEDVIRPGLALPLGANPPRRVGVLAGDAECYTVFRELLDPIICEYHGISNYENWEDPELPREGYFDINSKNAGGGGQKRFGGGHQFSEEDGDVIKSGGDDENEDESLDFDEDDIITSARTINDGEYSNETKPKSNLKRHCTVINNPLLVTNRKADPEGKYILSTRIRLARSLDGIRFPTTMSRSDRRKVQRLIEECTTNFHSPHLSSGTYLPILSMSATENLNLIERHILFDNPNEWTIAAGLGRDWPDGRALYANVTDLARQTPDFMIWVNEEDHLRIMCLRKGGDIQGVFTTLMNGVRELERELRLRNWQFAYDSRLGYLTSCPTNVGTTMRASVHVKLVNLGRLPNFMQLVESLRLEVRGKYGETDRENTGIFDISNSERLGKSEVHLINVMVDGVSKLIELEKRLEAGEDVDIDEIAKD